MDRSSVYLCQVHGGYPSDSTVFSPDKLYEEYPFGEVSDDSNSVYDGIRFSFFELGFDAENYGTASWNPLGEFISPGDTVLVKPNWVSHRNNNPSSGTDCLVTHTSLVRAVIDYCAIALGGRGKIILGDAPIQGADFKAILNGYHIRELVEFYKRYEINVEVFDLRDPSMTVYVDLGDESRFSSVGGTPKYHVMDYVEERTNAYHQDGRHVYAVNRLALEANVIINLPKPKCHKLAGITGAMKNLVGIVTEKETLPHERIGSPVNNGDSTNRESLVSDIVYRLRHRAEIARHEGRQRTERVLKLSDSLIRKIYRPCKHGLHLFGSWYGNDTIWRTVHDLNRIVRYCDVTGNLQLKEQRKVFTIADMVVAGEGEGPLAPSAKRVGIILFGADSTAVDALVARIMGFDYQVIPILSRVPNIDRLMDKTISSNSDVLNGKRIADVSASEPFLPHSGWKGHIEAGSDSSQ